MWKNDGSKPLFCVKRRHSEEYHTGGHLTGSQPQLYGIGPARSACTRLNKGFWGDKVYKGEKEPISFEDYCEHPDVKTYPVRAMECEYEKYCATVNNPWIVAIVQLVANEYTG